MEKLNASIGCQNQNISGFIEIKASVQNATDMIELAKIMRAENTLLCGLKGGKQNMSKNGKLEFPNRS